eukprot:3343292-Ditylum_brightwellii.AAC.1
MSVSPDDPPVATRNLPCANRSTTEILQSAIDITWNGPSNTHAHGTRPRPCTIVCDNLDGNS